MIELNGHNIILGGFHDHWSRWDEGNAALLLAALNYYHYDFVTLMCDPATDAAHRLAAETYSKHIRIYPGREEFFGWGHVVTVNPRAPRLEGDNPSYRQVLAQLKASCDLVILAHPSYPRTWEEIFHSGEMDRLLDEGLLDGVNLINTTGFEEPAHQELIAWFQQREASGGKTPIVGGWDAHLVLPQVELPPVLYSGSRSPRGHIDTCGANRTILIGAQNNLESICEAARDGRTVIEDMATGRLVGPARWVKFLQENGYAQAIGERDQWRDGQTLSVPRHWVSAREATIYDINEGETVVAVPAVEGLQKAQLVADENGLTVHWPAPPRGRSQDYALVARRDNAGRERLWAVEVGHPIQLDFLPRVRDGLPYLEIFSLHPFEGRVEVAIEETWNWQGRVHEDMELALPGACLHTVKTLRWRAADTGGLVREGQQELTFLTAPRFEGNWDGVPIYEAAEARYVPAMAYGAKRPYPGPDTFSVAYQFAWDDAAFYYRAQVTDPVHFQPFTNGHFLYNADCLQLALDPIMRRSESIGNVYSFNLALTDTGPMLHRWLTPELEHGPGFVPPPADTTVTSPFLKVEPANGGLVHELRLPWQELRPAHPGPGARMGIYCVAFNNNGEGLLDTLHWPVPIEGMWQCPLRWGVLNLVEA